ncbi:MAG: glucans biosynthesis glucosyltransferase MdoH [Sneathiella sp.]|uniref:glucans biosynthesis glucosyltransferase MdoH n=1 Tax=Sneathiella sp. TaxID=1964365 RepID=UPI000C490544|nr:glucans biosynthesis glucosyltransferase MdoH [Sneathiella sp.]MAZ04277.1 glucans biosynthesis glucosyltransferase MdoH [Sneathiella sp.]
MSLLLPNKQKKTLITSTKDARGGRFSIPFRIERRIVFFTLVLITAGLSCRMMFDILVANGMTLVELMILVLFTITFSWLVISFWSAVVGFLCQLLKIDPLSLRRRIKTKDLVGFPLTSQTAVVMPVYNEDPERVLAGLEATYQSLMETGKGEHFHFFLLSDTRNEDIAKAEEAGWHELVARLNAEGRLFYRRREDNRGKKAGNIEDFCRRWGRAYDHMLVLDADSVMSGDTIVTLARAMETNPDAGIIQTVPMPVRQKTFFGRYVQFASRLYSPMLATGLSFWQMSECNYWGHNAILRLQAFSSHCGLPTLPGKAPLGGDILSHDFVEAALIRRSNWHVYLMADLRGSYEELPGNLLDYAKRDKRWAQGNLQHLKLLGVRGLHGISRLHFTLGALAYVSSLLWLLLLVLTTIDGVMRSVIPHDFFGNGRQLFPDWQVVEYVKIISLFTLTVIMLIGPKIAGLMLTLFNSRERRSFGGGIRLVISAILETTFSIFLAPVMMCLHAYFVLTTLAGRVVTWDAQNRESDSLSYKDAIQSLWGPTVAGVIWAMIAWFWVPSLFYWLLPVTFGMMIAIPLAVWSSHTGLGTGLRTYGFLVTPEEVNPPSVLNTLEQCLEAPEDRPRALAKSVIMTPQEIQSEMSPAPISYYSHEFENWIWRLIPDRHRDRSTMNPKGE